MRCLRVENGRAYWRISDENRYLSIKIEGKVPTASILSVLEELARIARRVEPSDEKRSPLAKEFVEKAAEIRDALAAGGSAPLRRVYFRKFRGVCEEFWDRRIVSTETSAGTVKYFASICYYNLSGAVVVRAVRTEVVEREDGGRYETVRDIYIDAERRNAEILVEYIEDLAPAEVEARRRQLEGADFATLVRLAL